MRFSRAEDLSLVLLASLAKEGRWISLAEIARLHHLPLPYLRKLAGSLERAGLLTSRVGRNGGYQLARPPARIHLHEILEAVDNASGLVLCQRHPGRCPAESSCFTRQPLFALRSRIADEFAKLSLAKILGV